MIERTEACFGIKPEWLAADTAYGSASNLDWLVNEQGIAPHVPVIDKSKREDGTFSREDFAFDRERNVYVCPAGKFLKSTGQVLSDNTFRYLASIRDCGPCPLKSKCCPKSPQRRIPRDVHEDARDVARALAKTEAFAQSRRDRKKVEMLFAHLKRILRLGRLRLRGPSGAQFEFKVTGNKELRVGKSATVISNTSATPISGTFANLPDGSIFTVGPNTFQVSYSGGDGNDLTLTVVP